MRQSDVLEGAPDLGTGRVSVANLRGKLAQHPPAAARGAFVSFARQLGRCAPFTCAGLCRRSLRHMGVVMVASRSPSRADAFTSSLCAGLLTALHGIWATRRRYCGQSSTPHRQTRSRGHACTLVPDSMPAQTRPQCDRVARRKTFGTTVQASRRCDRRRRGRCRLKALLATRPAVWRSRAATLMRACTSRGVSPVYCGPLAWLVADSSAAALHCTHDMYAELSSTRDLAFAIVALPLVTQLASRHAATAPRKALCTRPS